jgi:O-phosphoseryl-tRNA(Cys) synthetase
MGKNSCPGINISCYTTVLFGIPRKKEWKAVFKEGVPTNIRFVDAFAAHQIEEAAERGEIDTDKSTMLNLNKSV